MPAGVIGLDSNCIEARYMSADLEVSVVMPVRNGERWVLQAIESVLRQTLQAFELIIVDDGSNDETPKILEAARRRDRRIRIVQQQPKGLVPALNRGVALAKAPLLARLDADDIAAPERLAKQASCFNSDGQFVLIGSWATRIDSNGRDVGCMRPATEARQLADMLMRRNPFVHSSVMTRTSLLRDLGGYRAAFLGAEDYDLWLRISERGTVANLPDALVGYRIHAGSSSRALGLRQSFSARLARAAAAARRSQGIDPANQLSEPPDWWAPEAAASFYAEAAHICRFLDCANQPMPERCRSEEVRLLSARQLFELSHVEARFAYRSLLNFMVMREAPRWISPGQAAAMALKLLGRPFFRS